MMYWGKMGAFWGGFWGCCLEPLRLPSRALGQFLWLVRWLDGSLPALKEQR